MKTARYEVVTGNRMSPGRILATFTSEKTHKCGGPATACLAYFRRHADKPGAEPMFFRKVS